MDTPRRQYLIDEHEAASLAGLKLGTFRVYRSQNKVPPPDGKISVGRGMGWYKLTIVEWSLKRNGKQTGVTVDDWLEVHGEDEAKGEELLVTESGLSGRANLRAYQAMADFILEGRWKVYPEIGQLVPGEGNTQKHSISSNRYWGGMGYLKTEAHWVDENERRVSEWVGIHRVIYEFRQSGEGINPVWEPLDADLLVVHKNGFTLDNRAVNLDVKPFVNWMSELRARRQVDPSRWV